MSGSKTCVVVGSGAFGLSIVYELLQRRSFDNTSVILVSPAVPLVRNKIGSGSPPLDLISSRDTTRIVRADYKDPAYASLAREAQELWRGEWGEEGRYNESGLLLTADEGSPGADYVTESLKNVRESFDASAVQETSQPGAISKAMRLPGFRAGTGNLGYLNGKSGWADASASMDWLFRKISTISQGRLKVISDAAERLVTSAGGERVRGCETKSGELVLADLTILATGAFTPSLIDTRGIASATGQSVLYVSITEDEAMRLKDIPVHMNLSSGCFAFPPTRKFDGSWEIKVAKHAFGFSNPTRIPRPMGRAKGDKDMITVSLPAFPSRLPAYDERILQAFLEKGLPSLNKFPIKAANMKARLCWYTDTSTGDFIASFHPSYQDSLFLATGGSGHAFKFLPVLGKRLVDVLDGTDGRDNGGTWTNKWKFPQPLTHDGNLVEMVWCEDGSRSGEPGRILQEALSDVSDEALLRSKL